MTTATLTTLAAAKEWLGISNTTDDGLLTRLIGGVSSAVQSRLGYQVASQGYTETRNGNGKSALYFRSPRVTAVSALSIDGVAVLARTSTTATGFAFDADFLFLIGQLFTKGVQNVVFTCTGGYAATPLDLEQAVLEVVALKYKEREHIGVSSKMLANETVSFFRNTSSDTMAVIESYRRVVLPE